MSGGTIKGGFTIQGSAQCDVVLLGGTITGQFNIWGTAKITSLTVAPWVNVTYDESGKPTAVISPANFTVSTTDLVAGAYNYAYGYAWELTATELNKLEIPANKTYYLWGRNRDGWYEYLDFTCRDGKNWQNAA